MNILKTMCNNYMTDIGVYSLHILCTDMYIYIPIFLFYIYIYYISMYIAQ